MSSSEETPEAEGEDVTQKADATGSTESRVDWQKEPDWTEEPKELDFVASAPPELEPVAGVGGIEGYRETTRGLIARWLMALLTLTVVALLLFAGLKGAGVVTSISIINLGQIVLTPVVTLTGTALGFYYGAQSATRANQDTANLLEARKPGFVRWLWRKVW